jgi:hypothetical protein
VVTVGEVPGKNRPELAKEIKPLPEMIQHCWKLNPKDRPTFKELKEKKQWDEAKVTAHGSDQGKILEIFQKDASESELLPFITFLKKCSDVWDEPKRLFFDSKEGKFESAYIRTLLAVLGLSKGVDKVSFKSVQRMIKWLKNVRGSECLDTLYRLYTQDYFFGVMEQERAEEIFAIPPPASTGAYLVRWSDRQDSFFFRLPRKTER